MPVSNLLIGFGVAVLVGLSVAVGGTGVGVLVGGTSVGVAVSGRGVTVGPGNAPAHPDSSSAVNVKQNTCCNSLLQFIVFPPFRRLSFRA